MNRKRKPIYILSFLCLYLQMSTSLMGQVKVTLTADTNAILIGDHLEVELSVIHPANIELSWPQLYDTLGNFEILALTEQVSSPQGSIIEQKQTLTLTIFDSGSYQIPPIPVFYGDTGSDSATDVSYTSAIPIEVATVAVDTTQAIKPIKAPIKAPYTAGEIFSWLGLLLLVGAIAYGAYWYWKKQQSKPKPVVVKPKVIIPPHEIALKRITELEGKKLWQQGETKFYYIELTEIIRQYIEARFFVPALESTTDEIMDGLKMKDFPDQLKTRLGDLLSMADFVKFAKLQPGPGQNVESMEIVKDFVQGTKPKIVVKAEAAAESETSTQIKTTE